MVHPFVFANSTELVVGELLLYHVSRQIERWAFPGPSVEDLSSLIDHLAPENLRSATCASGCPADR